MHPRVRGFGQQPRDQRLDRARSGERPLLQGHLKPGKGGRRAPDPGPAAEPESSELPLMPEPRPEPETSVEAAPES